MITRNNLRKIIGELVVLNDKRYKSAPVIIIKSISNYERRTILDNSNGKLELLDGSPCFCLAYFLCLEPPN